MAIFHLPTCRVGLRLDSSEVQPAEDKACVHCLHVWYDFRKANLVLLPLTTDHLAIITGRSRRHFLVRGVLGHLPKLTGCSGRAWDLLQRLMIESVPSHQAIPGRVSIILHTYTNDDLKHLWLFCWVRGSSFDIVSSSGCNL